MSDLVAPLDDGRLLGADVEHVAGEALASGGLLASVREALGRGSA